MSIVKYCDVCGESIEDVVKEELLPSRTRIAYKIGNEKLSMLRGIGITDLCKDCNDKLQKINAITLRRALKVCARNTILSQTEDQTNEDH